MDDARIAIDPECPPRDTPEYSFAPTDSAELLFGCYQCRQGLRLNDGGKTGPITIDLQQGPLAERLAKASPKKEILARACGVTKKVAPRVLDASGGLGRDAFILAKCGAQLTVYERHPLLAAMLREAADESEFQIEVVCADARALTPDDLAKFDTIYFDPMFPERKKAAAVKLDSQILQALHGGEEGDADAVLAHLLQAKAHRTVVKRPVKAEELQAHSRPNLRMRSGAMRFDVWLDF